MSVYYVYVYYDPRNGDPIYVGYGKEDRAFKHWRKKANNVFFQNVLNKIKGCGLQPRIEFVATDLELAVAKNLEVELIALFGRRDTGKGTLCNLTNGGDGTSGKKLTKEHAEKLKSGISEFWSTVDREKHGKKISATFAARSKSELEIVSKNISASRTKEVRQKIGRATSERMKDPLLVAKIVAGTTSEEARNKRQKSLKEFSNTDIGRELRRHAANVRWEKYRAEKLPS